MRGALVPVETINSDTLLAEFRVSRTVIITGADQRIRLTTAVVAATCSYTFAI